MATDSLTTSRRDLTVEELHHLVGAPLEPGAVLLRRNGGFLEASWKEALGGRGGWAWSLSLGTRVICYGWTSGDRRDRDGDFARARAEYRARCAS